MLTVATALLALTALFGSAAALLWLRRGRTPLVLAVAHLLMGIAGSGVLIASLHGAEHGEATGTASFGFIATALIGVALALGVAMLLLRLSKRSLPGALVGVHACLAVFGLVILAVYALLA